jgi:hypothetical protein
MGATPTWRITASRPRQGLRCAGPDATSVPLGCRPEDLADPRAETRGPSGGRWPPSLLVAGERRVVALASPLMSAPAPLLGNRQLTDLLYAGMDGLADLPPCPAFEVLSLSMPPDGEDRTGRGGDHPSGHAAQE